MLSANGNAARGAFAALISVDQSANHPFRVRNPALFVQGRPAIELGGRSRGGEPEGADPFGNRIDGPRELAVVLLEQEVQDGISYRPLKASSVGRRIALVCRERYGRMDDINALADFHS